MHSCATASSATQQGVHNQNSASHMSAEGGGSAHSLTQQGVHNQNSALRRMSAKGGGSAPLTTQHGAPNQTSATLAISKRGGTAFSCKLCACFSGSQVDFEGHCRGNKHREAVVMLRTNRNAVMSLYLVCEICAVSSGSKVDFETHLRGLRHKTADQARVCAQAQDVLQALELPLPPPVVDLPSSQHPAMRRIVGAAEECQSVAFNSSPPEWPSASSYGPPPGLSGASVAFSGPPSGLSDLSGSTGLSGNNIEAITYGLAPAAAKTAVDYTKDFEAAGGNVIEMLRNLSVPSASLDILSMNSVNTPLAIMTLHDEGLTALSMKKGPRMMIMSAVQSLTLPREDREVKVMPCG
jgi:hypothetical protein